MKVLSLLHLSDFIMGDRSNPTTGSLTNVQFCYGAVFFKLKKVCFTKNKLFILTKVDSYCIILLAEKTTPHQGKKRHNTVENLANIGKSTISFNIQSRNS